VSAYQVPAHHIAALVGTYVAKERYRTFSRADKLSLAGELSRENARSVNHRYAHHSEGCEPIPVPYELIAWFERHPLNPGAMFKALGGFEYQACETDDWSLTQAKEICDRMHKQTATRVAGYTSGSWCISDRSIVQTAR